MKLKLPYIIFEATSNCNLNCLYCYNYWKIPGMDFEHFNSYKTALKTLKKLFKIAEVGNVTFTGGEPLMAERISELILFARLKKASVNLITNGVFGNESKYKEIYSLGVSNFELPLHSFNPVTHDSMTRKVGSHRKVIDSVKIIQKLGGNVVIDIVLTKMNIPELSETISFIRELGISRIMLTRFNVGGEGIRHIKELLPTVEELKNTFKTVNQISKELDVKITSNVCTPLCVLNPNDYDNIATLSCSANINNMPVTLDINGNMRICNHSPVIIGNIFVNTIEEIMNADYVKSWKTEKPDYCSGCNIYNNCYGGCRAAAEQMGWGLQGVDPLIKLNGFEV